MGIGSTEQTRSSGLILTMRAKNVTPSSCESGRSIVSRKFVLLMPVSRVPDLGGVYCC